MKITTPRRPLFVLSHGEQSSRFRRHRWTDCVRPITGLLVNVERFLALAVVGVCSRSLIPDAFPSCWWASLPRLGCWNGCRSRASDAMRDGRTFRSRPSEPALVWRSAPSDSDCCGPRRLLPRAPVSGAALRPIKRGMRTWRTPCFNQRKPMRSVNIQGRDILDCRRRHHAGKISANVHDILVTEHLCTERRHLAGGTANIGFDRFDRQRIRRKPRTTAAALPNRTVTLPASVFQE